jgi:lipoprotein-anchoring transpeptidase ErfK/SrfK
MRPSLATSLLAFAFSLAAPALAAASILITVDRATQRMTVNVDGAPRWVWPVSTGRSGYATPSGNYTAFRMEEDHYSKEFDDAPMPHSIFFTKLGHAIHGTLDARHLGSASSHGCVRLSTANAAKLYALVQEQGLPNT